MKKRRLLYSVIILSAVVIIAVFAVLYGKLQDGILRPPAREFGVEEMLTNSPETPTDTHLLFPSFGISSIDAQIFKWAKNVEKRAREAAEPEVSSQYDAFFLKERFVSICERVSPSGAVKVFNVDLADQVFLETSDILDESHYENILALLRDKIKDPLIEAKLSFLDNLVLTHKGVEFVLPGIEKGFLLTYEELGSWFILFARPINAPEITPPPEIGPAGAVALTFDDGPSEITPQILDILKKYEVKATFFVLGSRVGQYEDIVARMVEEGHQVAGHSWNHAHFTDISSTEIATDLQKTNDAIWRAGGVRPTFYRPPYGQDNKNIRIASKSLGLSMINWSVDPEDWRTLNENVVLDAIMKNTRDGSIVLCHDIYPTTVAAIEKAIPELISRGFTLVTVGELLGDTQAGELYLQR